ncbi:MAG: glycosyltransferase family 4 protein [Pyrinomonadaceae bacterium]
MNKLRRLCFVGNMLGRNAGYVTTQGQIVADLLAKEGFAITCVSSKLNRAARLFEIVATLLKERREFDAVVIEVYSGPAFVIADVASWLCRFLRIPLIMFLHGGNLPEFVDAHRRWTKRVLDRADALAAPSRYLAEKVGRRGHETIVIPNVIDLAQYTFRERSSIKPRLLWMRSFHPIYNPEMAIRVFAQLRQILPEAMLTMAGVDKGYETAIKEIVAELGLTSGVRFPGFLDSAVKAREFSDADIYLSTSRIDNMPVSVVEACAFGVPVVATKAGGIPFLISDRENGLLVPDDVDAMTASIKELLDDPDLTSKLSLNGRRLAELSAWTNVRESWKKLVKSVAKPNRALAKDMFTDEGLARRVPERGN